MKKIFTLLVGMIVSFVAFNASAAGTGYFYCNEPDCAYILESGEYQAVPTTPTGYYRGGFSIVYQFKLEGAILLGVDRYKKDGTFDKTIQYTMPAGAVNDGQLEFSVYGMNMESFDYDFLIKVEKIGGGDEPEPELDATLLVYNQPAPADETMADAMEGYSLSAPGAPSQILMDGAVSGYTELQVSKEWGFFNLEYQAIEEPHVYLNGKELEYAMFPGMYAFELTEDFNVLKVYYEEPSTYDVKFFAPEGMVLFVVTDRDDMNAQSVDANGSISVLQGTEIQFGAFSGEIKSVKYNGLELTPDENDLYTIYANDASAVDINSEETGINAIGSESVNEEVIFNLQGIRVNSNLRELPAGLYIINGKKVVK